VAHRALAGVHRSRVWEHRALVWKLHLALEHLQASQGCLPWTRVGHQGCPWKLSSTSDECKYKYLYDYKKYKCMLKCQSSRPLPPEEDSE